jgi:cysteine desulfurase/selenocysteine lyase
VEADARSDLAAWRAEVPALALRVRGQRLAYLDNAATTLMAQPVIDAVARVATHLPGNVHRGVHALAEAADAAFEGARATIARHLGARPDEVVLTSGTTAAINLVAHAWGRANLGPGDAVVVSALEHHANLVPWQAVCAERGATLRIAPIDDAGRIDLAALDALLDARVKLIAVAHLSNVVGTIAPIAAIAARAHAVGARLLVDGAQALPHLAIDVAALGCDFYACSGHKAYGPTGTGALWGRAELLAAMPPWQHGGEMVAAVEATRARYREAPARFEAGTPNICGVIGLAAALDHAAARDRAAVAAHEARLHARLRRDLAATPGVRVLGEPEAAVVAFTVAGVHPHDVATIVDQEGVCVRSGLHCAEPLHARLGVDASVRASLAYYNDDADVDALLAGLARVREVFA